MPNLSAAIRFKDGLVFLDFCVLVGLLPYQSSFYPALKFGRSPKTR